MDYIGINSYLLTGVITTFSVLCLIVLWGRRRLVTFIILVLILIVYYYYMFVYIVYYVSLCQSATLFLFMYS
jgi:hypothetical protein